MFRVQSERDPVNSMEGMPKSKESNLLLFLPLLFLCLLAGCASPSSLTRNSSISGSQVIDVPIDTVYQEAINAAVDTQLLIASESYAEKEIRLKSGSYMTGMFLCSGNLLGIFSI